MREVICTYIKTMLHLWKQIKMKWLGHVLGIPGYQTKFYRLFQREDNIWLVASVKVGKNKCGDCARRDWDINEVSQKTWLSSPLFAVIVICQFIYVITKKILTNKIYPTIHLFVFIPENPPQPIIHF